MDYEKLLEKAKEAYKNCATDAEKRRLESIFPELAESEDEQIRKELLALLKENLEKGNAEETWDSKGLEQWLAWLEKQGEPKPYKGNADTMRKNLIKAFKSVGSNHWGGLDVRDIIHFLESKDAIELEKKGEKKSNNTETKFHEGDWVVHNGVGVYKIVEVCESWYEVISYNNDGIGIQYSIGFDKENDCHLWTIQDAKDGDVLVLFPSKGAERLFIFKEIKNSDVFKNAAFYPVDFHCTLVKNVFRIKSEFEYIGETNENFAPATKEQRKLLFSKMKEAGYEWDSENKSLRKQCNQESIDKVDPKFKVGDWIACDGLKTAIIVNIDGDKYEVEFIDGDKGFPHIDYVDRLFHHWTIEDADYGDVLAGHEYYVIFKEIDGLNIKCHCAYHYMGYNTSFYVETLQNKAAFHPATKEQRDLLFSKMDKAGYEWDSENKVIRKQDE